MLLGEKIKRAARRRIKKMIRFGRRRVRVRTSCIILSFGCCGWIHDRKGREKERK